MPLNVAAIRFLNPAPLMWDLEHEPQSNELAERYTIRYMQPSQCAAEVLSGASDLGLIPIASLTPELAIVPGCVIASLEEVRSILLLVKRHRSGRLNEILSHVRTVATDTASRSSAAYAHIIFEHVYGFKPQFIEHAADPIAMLQSADAALLIGDPALLAWENSQRIEIESAISEPLVWIDVAKLWRQLTGLPWVAAVWAVRTESLSKAGIAPQQLITDLNTSRDHGLAHIEDLVAEWTPRLALPAQTIRRYLTDNIHYVLDDDCTKAILHFRRLASQIGVLPPLHSLNMLP